jgi:hypothetical protein
LAARVDVLERHDLDDQRPEAFGIVCSSNPTPPALDVASPVNVSAKIQAVPPISPLGWRTASVEPRQRPASVVVGCA